VNVIDNTIDFAAYQEELDAKTKVKSANSYIADLKDRLYSRQTEKIAFLPWEGTKDNFEFRAGEVTLWSGQNGHGKSLITSQVALSLIGQNEKICVASFEMKPLMTLQRMARMWAGLNPLSQEFQTEEGKLAIQNLYNDFGDWTHDKLWLYDQMGTANQDIVAGMVRYCAKVLNITHVFVDNLAKCVRGEDDFNGQKRFVDELTAIARDYEIHIHLVHHLRKPANENAVPDKHDNKGSGAITDQVDNVMLVWRNKPKEDDLKLNGVYAERMDEPDHYLLCRKQRNYEGSGEGEPTIKLWFLKDAQQYIAKATDKPMFFPNYPHVETPF
jgi:twinkle protein